MKILYVHYRPAKTEAQVKALADKVKLLKEVSTKPKMPYHLYFYDQIVH